MILVAWPSATFPASMLRRASMFWLRAASLIRRIESAFGFLHHQRAWASPSASRMRCCALRLGAQDGAPFSPSGTGDGCLLSPSASRMESAAFHGRPSSAFPRAWRISAGGLNIFFSSRSLP